MAQRGRVPPFSSQPTAASAVLTQRSTLGSSLEDPELDETVAPMSAAEAAAAIASKMFPPNPRGVGVFMIVSFLMAPSDCGFFGHDVRGRYRSAFGPVSAGYRPR